MTEYLEQSEKLKALQEDARSKGEEPDVVVPEHPPQTNRLTNQLRTQDQVTRLTHNLTNHNLHLSTSDFDQNEW